MMKVTVLVLVLTALCSCSVQSHHLPEHVVLALVPLSAAVEENQEGRTALIYTKGVPQWQVIHAGNWRKLEDATRKYAKDHRVVLDVWTGAIGVTTLKDVNGTFKEIYLARDNKNHPIPFKLPAPRLMWKMIHDPESGTGIVVIMINNPYEENHLEEDRALCPGVCDRSSLVKWDRRNVTKGYTICCNVAEFKKAFPEVSAPGLDDLGDIPLLAEKEEKPLEPVKPENPDENDEETEDDGDGDDPDWKPETRSDYNFIPLSWKLWFISLFARIG